MHLLFACDMGLSCCLCYMQVHDDVLFADETSDSAEEYNDSDNPDEEGHYTHDYPDEPSDDDISEKRSSRSDSSDEGPDWRQEW